MDGARHVAENCCSVVSLRHLKTHRCVWRESCCRSPHERPHPPCFTTADNVDQKLVCMQQQQPEPVAPRNALTSTPTTGRSRSPHRPLRFQGTFSCWGVTRAGNACPSSTHTHTHPPASCTPPQTRDRQDRHAPERLGRHGAWGGGRHRRRLGPLLAPMPLTCRRSHSLPWIGSCLPPHRIASPVLSLSVS